MQRGIVALELVLALAAIGRAAAPPAQPRNLTAQEQKEVAVLFARGDRHADAGEFEQMAKLAQQVADYRRERQGASHWQAIDARLEAEAWKKRTAVPLKDRAELLRAMRFSREGTATARRGRFEEGEKLLRQALTITQKALGEDHPDNATSYNNLAICLNDQGKTAAALALHRKALAIRQKALGEIHPSTAAGYNNVAHCLQEHGKASDALPLYRQALAIFQKALGEIHPDTALGYNNVAYCLLALGRSSEALPLFRRALAIREKTLDESHPDVALSYNNVAVCLQALGKFSEALPLYRKALAIYQKVLGESDPQIAGTYNNVASCLEGLGKSSEALPLYRKALAIYQKVLGESHRLTATACNNLAGCLCALGKHAEALPLYRQALAISQKVFGENHPQTARGYNNLGTCLHYLGRPSEALPLYQKGLAILQKVLGESHPDTAKSYSNVADCLYSLGKSSEALPLFQKALSIRQKALGENHPHTAASYTNLARWLVAARELSQAARLWQQSLPGQEAARFHLTQESGFDRAVAQSRAFSARAGLAVVLAELRQPRNAFTHAEASLARGLLDDLGSSNPEVARLSELESRRKKLDSALIAFAGINEPTEEQSSRHRGTVREQRAILDEMAQIVSEDSARRVLPLERIQKAIPDDSALVLWIDIGLHWACVVRRQGGPVWVKLPATGKGGSTSEQKRTLPARLHQSFTEPGTSEAEHRKLSDAFVKQLFEPLRPHLKGVKRLFVVPSGPLARIPLEALTDDFSISYVPSGSILARIVENHRPVDGSSLLALGDPIFDRTAPPEPPASGVLILSVLPGSNAARAGLQAGDVLLSLGGVGVESAQELPEILKQAPATISFWRDGQRLKGRLPAAPLGATIDPRSIRAAVRAWRREREVVATRGTGHKRLPGTRIEAEAIASLVKGGMLLLGSDASEQKLDELIGSGKLKSYRLLHVATHGETDEQRPSRSALILAQDRLPDALEQSRKGQHVYDGRLTVSRIRNHWKDQLDADLVVLSACETGLGKETQGDGLLGFAQAFLSCGVRSLILTRWKVDDTATSLLMIRFYENLLGKRKDLKKPMGRAESLDEAKKWLRSLTRQDAERLATHHAGGVLRGSEVPDKPLVKVKPVELKGDRPFAHPYYWAAFTLIGDPD